MLKNGQIYTLDTKISNQNEEALIFDWKECLQYIAM